MNEDLLFYIIYINHRLTALANKLSCENIDGREYLNVEYNVLSEVERDLFEMVNKKP